TATSRRRGGARVSCRQRTRLYLLGARRIAAGRRTCRVVATRTWLHERNIHVIGDMDRLAEERVVEGTLVAHRTFSTTFGVECKRRAEPVRVVALRELGLEVRAARLVAVARALRDDTCQDDHVFQVAHELGALVGALGGVGDADAREAILELVDLRED